MDDFDGMSFLELLDCPGLIGSPAFPIEDMQLGGGDCCGRRQFPATMTPKVKKHFDM